MILCRFCHRRSVVEIFPSNKTDTRIAAKQFACTNSGFGNHGPIVRCSHCQIVYVNEDLSQQEVSTYYEVADDPVYFAEQGAREKTFGNYLKKLESIYPSKGKLLDIGTNTGLFVKLAQGNGWDAIGLEPNRWAVEYAKKHYQVDLVNKSFAKGIFPKSSFSVVTMWDVIEHFTDPPSEIKKVYDYLALGGVFAFSTVDPDSLFAKAMGTKWSWYMEMHRVFFNRFCVRRYLEQAGFKNIIFRSHWRFLSLGYLATRFQAVNPTLAKIAGKFFAILGLSKTIVPYYANDLFDCYAFKKD